MKKTVELKAHIRDERITHLQPCTPSFVLHQLTEENDFSKEILNACSNFLKIVFDKKVFIINLADPDRNIVKEIQAED